MWLWYGFSKYCSDCEWLTTTTVIMHNNNYLPDKTYNSVMTRTEAMQQSVHSDVCRQFCSNTEWTGINTETVMNSQNCQHVLGTTPCEHQGSNSGQICAFLVPNDVSDNQLPTFSVNNSVGYSGATNFTFTSPTQSSLHSPALVSYTPARFHSSRTVSHTFAPTGFTQWQHSVPHRLPWSSVGITTQSGFPVFTGSATLQSCSTSQPSSSWTTSHMRGPVASCSEQPRRPKRPSSENAEYLGPTNKIHITEEKFAKHMEGLSLNCMATPDTSIQNGGAHLIVPSGQPVTQQFPSVMQSVKCNSEQSNFANQWRDYMASQTFHRNQWRTFQELEDSLEVSDEEVETERSSKTRKTLPTVHMVQHLQKLMDQPDIIPKKILEEMQRPRMEIMLWTPPGDTIKQFVESCQTEAEGSKAKTDNADSGFISTSPRFPEAEAMLEDDNSMDIEPGDSLVL